MRPIIRKFTPTISIRLGFIMPSSAYLQVKQNMKHTILYTALLIFLRVLYLCVHYTIYLFGRLPVPNIRHS